MGAVTHDPALLEETEVWFVRHGLPWFVPREREAAAAALRPRRLVPLLGLVLVLGAAVAVALATLLDEFSFAPAAITLIVALAALWYGVTAVRARPIVTWAVSHTMSSLRVLLPMVARALPLLLVFVTFLFINAEVWQLASHLDGGVLWLTVLLFAAMAVVFLVVRLPEELDSSDHELDETRLRAALRGTPLEPRTDDVVASSGPVLAEDTRIGGFERANLVLVLVVAQVSQVLLLTLAVFVFFLLFGGISMQDSVAAAWVGSDTHHVSWLPNVSVELVQVAVFLSAFSGLYFTVVVVTDETYREQFFTGVMQELDRALGVRAAYLTLPQE